MCGITGIYAFNLVGKFHRVNVTAATMALEKRGPDFQDVYLDDWVGLGHRRLSIIDTSSAGNQPMWDPSGRYGIVYNGEIFNFTSLRKELEDKGKHFTSTSDTEVLLQLFIDEKEKCLHRLNGFFSFCVYDRLDQTMFLARDQFGIKPLLYLFDEDKFIFSSDLNSMLQYGLDREVDLEALSLYLQLNYVPAPLTMVRHVRKLMPGHYLKIGRQHLEEHAYYQLPNPGGFKGSYEQAKGIFIDLLEKSVQRRLVSDVPLVSFLSGGVDSSAIAALAARHKPDIHTFSIGYRDEKFFDETKYAKLVANHLGTDHTVFSLSNDDFLSHLNGILNSTHEPFADSSAIAVYILSKETRKHATVALSGDGADELLAGYNKHMAFYRCFRPGLKEHAVKLLAPLWSLLPRSRGNSITNRLRQLDRFAKGMHMSLRDRYWSWATFISESSANALLHESLRDKVGRDQIEAIRNNYLSTLSEDDFNSILVTDTRLVLPNDMLAKVDSMSMANSLEVRPPFLDRELVDFLFSLPDEYKINPTLRKRVLQDSLRDLLPEALYNRPKKGFEVPLLKWFRKDLKSKILNEWLSEAFIEEQGLFDPNEVRLLKQRLLSSNPGDVHAQIWALIVFQHWWKAHLG